MYKLGTTLMTLGVLTVLGTAGASDLNSISITSILLQSMIGVLLSIIGYVLRLRAKRTSINKKVLLLYKAQKISRFEEPIVRDQLSQCSNERDMRRVVNHIIIK